MPNTDCLPSALDRALTAMQAQRAATTASPEIVRACAAEVLHLWDAPAVVRDYLLTAAPELRADAARTAWSVVGDFRASAFQAHAARAAARAIDGDPASRVLSAAAAAVDSYAAAATAGRGTLSYDAGRQAADALRAVWEPRLRPRAAQQGRRIAA